MKEEDMQIELEKEADGRLLATIEELPGVMAYGATPEDATRAVVVLALRVLADRIERGEPVPSGVVDQIGMKCQCQLEAGDSPCPAHGDEGE